MKPALLVGVLTASITLLLAYAMELHWQGAVMAMGLGIVGWFGPKFRKFLWSADLFLAGVLILVTIGVLIGLKVYLLLPATLGALAAWDLTRFQKRVEYITVFDGIQIIEKRHLGFLVLALGSGGIFAGFVLTTRIPISFGIALVCGVILIIILGKIFQILRN
ncbi:hypothetical protein ACFLXI_00560 [Chloroflexota bacterium]